MLSVPSEILQTSPISLPQLSFSWHKRCTLLNHIFYSSFQNSLSALSLFSEYYSVLLQHFSDEENRTGPSVQDRAALWTQSHKEIFSFLLRALPSNSYYLVCFHGCYSLFIELWIITPRSFFLNSNL